MIKISNKFHLKLILINILLVVIVSACERRSITHNELSSGVLARAEVTNANSFSLVQEPLYFSFYELGLVVGDKRLDALSVVQDGKVLPHQLIDKDGDGSLDGVLVITDFDPAQIKPLDISFGIKQPTSITLEKKKTQAEVSVKEGGEWKGKEYVGGHFKNVNRVIPPPQYTDHSFYLRYEGPGIESDKIGYRVYLDWRNGFDIFGKKVNDLVLQNVGQDGYEKYHREAPWGQDILKVGNSLGVGGFGFWNGKSVDLVSQVDSRETIITNNGDLYSAFKINYHGWSINNQKLNIAAHIAMNAGSRLAHVQLTAKEVLPNLAIGLVKLPSTSFLQGNSNIAGDAWTYVATWGKQSLSNAEDNLGLAVIFRRADRKEQTQDDNSYVSVMNNAGGELEYYFVAAWDKEPNGITTEAEFKAYLDREVERLTKGPRIRFESSLSANAKKNLDAQAALGWAKVLADSELARKTLNYHLGGWDAYRKRLPKFEYDVVGMQIQALQEIDSVSPDDRYKKALETVTGSYIQADGKISAYEPELFSIDLIKPGQMVILLEQRTQETKYRKAADYLRERLRLHPRTSEGAFWHRATYPNQLWLDGVYMGMPFLAQYAAAYEKGDVQHKSFEEVVHEFVIARNHLRNPETGLYYHAWDELKKADWANKENGRASQYWSRGMGWYAMAMVDVLDFIPESETDLRKTLIDIINEFAADILRYQDQETSAWWQITDKPNGLGNYRESSATAMFSYFLLKSVNKHYLPASYRAAAIKTYSGLINEFVTVHPDGKISMTDQCLVAGLGFGRDGSYNYYLTEMIVSNDPKGNSPFIFASVEAYKLLK